MSQLRRSTRATKRNLRIGIGEGILATPWVFLSVPGGFVMAALITQFYGIGLAIYGLIVSLPAWANALQIIYLPVVGRFLKERDMALAPSWLNLGLWLMLGFALPLLPRDQPDVSTQFFIFFFLFASFCGSLITVGWTSWVRGWVPSRVRGTYFGLRNLAIQFTTVAFLFIAMLLLEGTSDSVLPFQILIFLAVAMRFFSILWQHLIVAPEKKLFSQAGVRWHHEIVGVWKHRPFRLYCFFAMWTAFWMNACGPFLIIYGFDYLELSKSQFAVLTLLATLSGAFMMPVWGRMADRFGCVRMIVASLLIWWTPGYIWLFLTPSTTWVLYFTWFFGGAAAGGFIIGSFSLLFKVIPEGSTTNGISLNMALASAAGAVAPMLFGYFLSLYPEYSKAQKLAYQVLIATAVTSTILSGLIARQIPERKLQGKAISLAGAMRSFRGTMLSLGLAFVNNINLVRQPAPRKPPEDNKKESQKEENS